MTREEAIKRIKVHITVHRFNDPNAIRISEALNMAIKALEQESDWTPCTERLPEENEFYWTTIHEPETNTDFCEKLFYGTSEYPQTKEVGWYFLPDDGNITKVSGVIAWMPLPKPYEEVEE